VLHQAIDLGINFIDTADHNNGNNEELLAKALKGKRDQLVLASKFGNLRGQAWAEGRDVNGSPEYVPVTCEASLRRLQLETIDLYYCIASIRRLPSRIPSAMVRLISKERFATLD
jgi:aryl-alcohol dehydrogenase-like predicted oxidoreductase